MKNITISHSKQALLKKFTSFVSLIQEYCTSIEDAYLRLDLIEFIQNFWKLAGINASKTDFRIASNYGSVQDFIKSGGIGNYTNSRELIRLHNLIYNSSKVSNYTAWIRAIGWNILKSTFNEIENFQYGRLSFNPYLSAIFNFSNAQNRPIGELTYTRPEYEIEHLLDGQERKDRVGSLITVRCEFYCIKNAIKRKLDYIYEKIIKHYPCI